MMIGRGKPAAASMLVVTLADHPIQRVVLRNSVDVDTRVCTRRALRIGLGMLCDWSLELDTANYLSRKLKTVYAFLRARNHCTTASQATPLRTLHVDLYMYSTRFPTSSSLTQRHLTW